jgi:uncharacterized membrane protein YGL010W
MKTINQWFLKYGKSHQNKTNKLIHWMCVPLIFFSAYGLLTLIPSGLIQNLFPDNIAPYINYGNVAFILVLFFYIRLSMSLFIGMFIYSALCVYIAMVIEINFATAPWIIYTSIFVLAWIGQFIGHHIEGEKPSFIDDLQFLLIGPAWVISFLYKKMGIKL